MRVDPLLLLTLAGLAGAGLLAALHPVEDLDIRDPAAQAGRHVRVTLIVDKVQVQPDWWRGSGLPVDDAGNAYGTRVDWVWFRPPAERALAGDRITGQALVERDGARAALLLDGPNTASIEPGPHPVAVSWNDLLDDPAGLAGRALVVNGRLDGEALHGPDGRQRCLLAEGTAPERGTTRARSHDAGRWLVRLEPDPDAPAWRCRVEGPAP